MTIKDQLRKLNRRDLAHLRDFIDTLIGEAEEAEEGSGAAEETTGPQDSSGKQKDGGKGWIEVKMIGKAGPYAYRRWVEVQKLRYTKIGVTK